MPLLESQRCHRALLKAQHKADRGSPSGMTPREVIASQIRAMTVQAASGVNGR